MSTGILSNKPEIVNTGRPNIGDLLRQSGNIDLQERYQDDSKILTRPAESLGRNRQEIQELISSTDPDLQEEGMRLMEQSLDQAKDISYRSDIAETASQSKNSEKIEDVITYVIGMQASKYLPECINESDYTQNINLALTQNMIQSREIQGLIRYLSSMSDDSVDEVLAHISIYGEENNQSGLNPFAGKDKEVKENSQSINQALSSVGISNTNELTESMGDIMKKGEEAIGNQMGGIRLRLQALTNTGTHYRKGLENLGSITTGNGEITTSGKAILGNSAKISHILNGGKVENLPTTSHTEWIQKFKNGEIKELDTFIEGSIESKDALLDILSMDYVGDFAKNLLDGLLKIPFIGDFIAGIFGYKDGIDANEQLELEITYKKSLDNLRVHITNSNIHLLKGSKQEEVMKDSSSSLKFLRASREQGLKVEDPKFWEEIHKTPESGKTDWLNYARNEIVIANTEGVGKTLKYREILFWDTLSDMSTSKYEHWKKKGKESNDPNKESKPEEKEQENNLASLKETFIGKNYATWSNLYLTQDSQQAFDTYIGNIPVDNIRADLENIITGIQALDMPDQEQKLYIKKFREISELLGDFLDKRGDQYKSSLLAITKKDEMDNIRTKDLLEATITDPGDKTKKIQAIDPYLAEGDENTAETEVIKSTSERTKDFLDNLPEGEIQKITYKGVEIDFDLSDQEVSINTIRYKIQGINEKVKFTIRSLTKNTTGYSMTGKMLAFKEKKPIPAEAFGNMLDALVTNKEKSDILLYNQSGTSITLKKIV